MDILKFLGSLLVLALVLFIAFRVLKGAFEILVNAWPLFLGAGIGIPMVIKVWSSGHDNMAVIWATAFIAATVVGQKTWSRFLYKCPFCGSTDTRLDTLGHTTATGGPDVHACNKCGKAWKTPY